MNLREVQAPLKQRYREEASAAQITLHAEATQDTPVACSVDIGRAIHSAQAHAGVGGAGTGACSGDLLLGALAACAQITCQMVATAAGIPVGSLSVSVEGDLDLRGTLGVSREVPVGFQRIRVEFKVDAPDAKQHELDRLKRLTEQYCVVMQTLLAPPAIDVTWP
jgi:uncharacterized OsmC-like protein